MYTMAHVAEHGLPKAPLNNDHLTNVQDHDCIDLTGGFDEPIVIEVDDDDGSATVNVTLDNDVSYDCISSNDDIGTDQSVVLLNSPEIVQPIQHGNLISPVIHLKPKEKRKVKRKCSILPINDKNKVNRNCRLRNLEHVVVTIKRATTHKYEEPPLVNEPKTKECHSKLGKDHPIHGSGSSGRDCNCRKCSKVKSKVKTPKYRQNNGGHGKNNNQKLQQRDRPLPECRRGCCRHSTKYVHKIYANNISDQKMDNENIAKQLECISSDDFSISECSNLESSFSLSDIEELITRTRRRIQTPNKRKSVGKINIDHNNHLSKNMNKEKPIGIEGTHDVSETSLVSHTDTATLAMDRHSNNNHLERETHQDINGQSSLSYGKLKLVPIEKLLKPVLLPNTDDKKFAENKFGFSPVVPASCKVKPVGTVRPFQQINTNNDLSKVGTGLVSKKKKRKKNKVNIKKIKPNTIKQMQTDANITPIQRYVQGGSTKQIQSEANITPIKRNVQVGSMEQMQSEANITSIETNVQVGSMEQMQSEANITSIETNVQVGSMEQMQSEANITTIETNIQVGSMEQMQSEAKITPIETNVQVGSMEQMQSEANITPIETNVKIGAIKQMQSEVNIKPIEINVQIDEIVKERYKVNEIIKRGHFSNVVRATDNQVGENVVLKVLHQNTSSEMLSSLNLLNSADTEDRFHCVRLHGQFQWSGHVALCLESYSCDLRECLKSPRGKNGFPLATVQGLGRQLLMAVQLLTEQHILHGDIKPEHVLINSGHTSIKLAGFDGARDVQKNPGAIPRLGPIRYRSPEAVLGLELGHTLDVWSAACLLYEVATGRQLFSAGTASELLWQVMEINGSFPERLRNREHFDSMGRIIRYITSETGQPTATTTAPPARRDLRAELAGGGRLRPLGVLLHAMLLADPQRRLSAHCALLNRLFQATP